MGLPLIVRHTACVPTLRIAQDDAADELLGRDPLALLIGMLLDQQFPMERAFGAPAAARRPARASTLTRGGSPRRPRGASPRSSRAAGAAPLPRLDGRPHAGPVPRCWSSATTATPRSCGPTPRRRDAAAPARRAARLRRAEVEDLPRAARQAVRRHPAGLAGGGGRLRPRGLAPLGRRHHRPGVAGRGPRLQAGAEAGGQGGRSSRPAK